MIKPIKRVLSTSALALLIGTGLYNAFLINANTGIPDGHFTKRLDEITGVVVPGRMTASLGWKKIEKAPAKNISEFKMPKKDVVAEDNSTAESAVKDDLNLSLDEVVNPVKWSKGLNKKQFAGNLLTSNGMIESLNVSLPDKLSLSITSTDMKGNVFDYDFDGVTYSGMIYQVEAESYMVTLTNGPLEGTRLKFSGAKPEVPVAQFGEEIQAQETTASASNDLSHDLPVDENEATNLQGYRL